jgi:hypothetical protein
MSFAVPLFATVGLVAICVFLIKAEIRFEQIKVEERAAFLQNSGRFSTAP